MMRNVLITGGTGSVGTALIKGLCDDGHRVTFTTRNSEKGEAIIKSLGETDLVSYIEVDFDKDDAIDTILNGLDEQTDAVIHNARNVAWLKINEDGTQSPEQWQGELYMAVTFPYSLTEALIRSGRPLKDVLFVSSMYGNVAANPHLYTDFHKQSPINYGVAKAAQIHLTKEMAVRYADKEIKANCISYGGVEGRVDDAFKERYAKLTPLKKMLTHDNLYPPVQYILNNKGLLMTGENLKVDGGWTIW